MKIQLCGSGQVRSWHTSNAVVGETFTTRVLRLFEDHVLYEHKKKMSLCLRCSKRVWVFYFCTRDSVHLYES
jgi:hypothetical protein